jgi:hypothetical protein
MKFFATITLLVAMAAFLPAQRMTLTSPREGETWLQGSTKLITWDNNGYTGTYLIEIGKSDLTVSGVINPSPYRPATDRQYSWKVGVMATIDPPDLAHLPAGSYFIQIVNLDEGIWSRSVTFTISSLLVELPRLKYIPFIEFHIPLPPDPCLCPEFDLKPLQEAFAKLNSPVRVVLMREGLQVQELGSFATASRLPSSLKAQLGQKDFDLLKGGKAKFTLAVLGAQGKILSQHALQPQKQILLKQR